MLALLSCPVGAQTVTFTGQEDEDGQLRLNRVVVSNRTQGWQGIVFGPDTLLTLQNMTEAHHSGRWRSNAAGSGYERADGSRTYNVFGGRDP